MPTRTTSGAGFHRSLTYVQSGRTNGKLVLATNPMRLLNVTAQPLIPEARAYRGYEGLLGWLEGNGSGIASGLATFDTPLKGMFDAAYRNCFSRLKDKVWQDSRAMMMVDAAEGKKTFQMLADQLSNGVKALRFIRRGKLVQAARQLQVSTVPAIRAVRASRKGRVTAREVVDLDLGTVGKSFADNWLTMRYGIIPFVSSVQSTIRAIDTQINSHVLRGRWVEAQASGDGQAFGIATSPTITSNGSYELRVKMKCQVRVVNQNLVRAEQFGLTEIASTAWELFPLSFVLDWFVGVGDWLDSLELCGPGLSVTHMSRTTYLSGVETLVYQQKKTAASIVGHAKQRQTFTYGFPQPPIRIGAELNWKRCVDSIALLTNLLRR